MRSCSWCIHTTQTRAAGLAALYWPFRAHARLTPALWRAGCPGCLHGRPLGTRLPDDKSSLFVFMQRQPKQN